MVAAEEIAQKVERLPTDLRAEVLHFVDYLLTRAADRQEDRGWSGLSLESAMRGLEDEGDPDYSEADLRERFS